MFASTTCATVLSNEALMSFPNTATKTTRPRPTMSAAAVVGSGRGCASRSRGRAGPARRTGARVASRWPRPGGGRTSAALRTTPTNSSTTPPAIITAGWPPAQRRTKSATSIATPSIATMAATRGAERAREPCSSCPCSAAIGETRVARRAGASAAIRVTPIPTPRDRATVPGFSPAAAVGSPRPIASNIDARAFANASPSKRPSNDAATPITSASVATAGESDRDRRVCGGARTRACARRR